MSVSSNRRWISLVLAALVVAAAPPFAEAQAPEPAAAFALGEGAGDTFGDSTGNGSTGTMSGASWTPSGRFGSALAFDGLDDFATASGGAGFDPTTGMTLEAWVYPTADSNGMDDGGGAIVMREDAVGTAYALFTKGRNVRFVAKTLTSGSLTEVRALNDLPLMTWSHVAAVFDGSTLRLYVNGMLVAWKPRAGALAKTANPVRIGGFMQNEVFAGRIDEVRLYRRALTPAEIQADMAMPITPLPGPDVTAPSVAIISPASGNTVAGTVRITATASDEKGVTGVQFLLDGAPFGPEVTSAPYSVNWDTRTATNTVHSWSARARDTAGNVGVTPSNVDVSVYNAPTLAITQPTGGASIDGDVVPVAYATTGDLTGVDHVHFQLADGAEIEDPTFDGQFQLTGVAEGPHVLTAVLVRADHSPLPATQAAPVSFSTVMPDVAPPAVMVTSPVAGASVSGTVTVTATATDAKGVTAVQFLLDGEPLGAEDSSFPYEVTWDTHTTTNTTHSLSARARDGANNVGTTPGMVLVTVYNAPTLTITRPAAGESINGGTLDIAYVTSGDLTGVDHLHFRVDNGAEVEDASVDGQFQLTGLSDGSHVLTAVLARADHSPMPGTNAAPVSFETILPDVAPPVITMTAPAADSTVASTVTVTADATDAKGVVGVQFLLDGAPLGAEVTNAPYAVTWDTHGSTNTTHTLTARARDAAGNIGTTLAGVVVTVYNAPTLTITQPAAGTLVEGEVVNVAYATAGDLTGADHVHLRLDGGPDLEDASLDGVFQLTAVAEGAHVLRAVLVRADHSPMPGTEASPVSFDTVIPDVQPPVITLTSPAPGDVGSFVKVMATATDNKGVAAVQFLLDGQPLGAEVTSGPYVVSWDTRTATNSTHTLSARARDAAGNVGTTSTGVVVMVYNAPTLTITQPVAGASIESDIVNVAYTTAGDLTAVDHVHFLLDGEMLFDDASLDNLFQLTEVQGGSHVLTAVLVRADHSPLPDSDAAPVAFTTIPPDVAPPMITLTAPASDATVAGTVTVTASASDKRGVVGVQFLLDGAPLGAEVTSAPYAVTWDTHTAKNTTHTLTARARDAAGNIGTTETGVVVTVYNPAKLTITQPAAGASIDGDMVTVAYTTAGDLTGADHVHFRLDGGADLEDASLDGQFQLTDVAGGNHALTAVLVRADHSPLPGTDAAPVSFETIPPDRTAPVITLTAPAPDATVANTVAVTATATDAKGVVAVQFLLDGAPLGAEVTSAPYTVTWDTHTATNTTHTLTARARDAAGNVGTTVASVAVTVYNPAKLTITQPAAGASIDGDVVNVAYTISGDLTGVDHVHFRLADGAVVEDPTLDGQFQLTQVAEGSHVLTAVLVRADHSPLAGTEAAPASFATVMPDVTAPALALTAPAADSTVANTVTVTANATDARGVVGVQFLLDGAPLGAEVTAAPYAVTWDTHTATNTTHTLTARARDAAGNVGTTASGVVVTVYNPAKLTITQPAAGASIENDVVNVAYTTAGDLTGVDHVHFRLDGADLEDASLDGQFQLTNVAEGTHALTAVLVRADHSPLAGTDAAPVSFETIAPDRTAPVITLTAPAPDATVANTVTVTATATDAKGVVAVQFLLDGAPLGAEVTSAPYAVTWDTHTAKNLTHTLTARARDAAGNVGTTTASVVVTVYNPAKLTITQPTAGASIDGDVVNVAYTTAGDLTGVDHVHFRLGEGADIEDPTLDGQAQLTQVAEGSHVLTAVLVRADHSPLAGTDAAPVSFETIVRDTTAPAVTLTAPAADATVANTVTVTATATDAKGVVGVQFLLDGAPLGAEVTTAPYEVTWDTHTATNTTHTLTARARDAAGNVGTTAPGVVVTVYNPAKLTITQPAAGATIDGDVVTVAYATAGDLTGVHHVHFRLDSGAELEDASLDGQFQLTGVAGGAHALTGVLVRADHSHLAGTDATPVAFETIAPDRTAPAITLTAPAPDATVANTVTVTATATDEKGVVGVQFLLDGAPLGAEVTNAPYAVTWDTHTAKNTTHTLTARARDAAGNVGTTATSVVVTVYNPAKLTITQPTGGASLDADVVTVAYTTAGDLTGVDHVHFRLDTGAEVEDPTLDNQFQLTGVTEGNHVLTGVLVRADHSPLAGTDATAVSFGIVLPDTTAPAVSLTAPAGDTTLSGTVTVTATATDAKGVVGVQFLLDGAPLGAEVTSAPYEVTWDTRTATDTAHTLTARARDAAGNVGTSAAVLVTVDNRPPKLTITQPAAGATVNGATVNVQYTATGNLTGVDHVHFRLDNLSEVMDLSLDGVYQFAAVTPGPHVLNGYLVRSNHSKIAGTDAQQVSFTTVMPDMTPPVITLTTPASGASVSGAVTVMATATDDTAVAGVQFLVDNVELGAMDSEAPYAISWQTAAAGIGPHTLTAVAYDSSGNTAVSQAVSVTVTNLDPAAQTGKWGTTMNWPLVAVHGTLMHTGEILLWDGWEAPAQATVWNPVTNTFRSVPNQSGLFCAAHSMLPDGRILVSGGHAGGEVGIVDANSFDPVSRAWTTEPNMSTQRWYPSSTTLGDGRVLVLSGQLTPGVWADTPEIYNPETSSWSRLNGVNTGDVHDPEYLQTTLLPDGRIAAIAASTGQVRVLDVALSTWTNFGTNPELLRGSLAMYRPGRILATGGGDVPNGPSDTRASVIDFNDEFPEWRQTAPMAFPRYNHTLVVLADGSVLAVGGATTVNQTSQTGTLAAELWNPVTETWQTMTSMRDPRMYHSIAMLLPDGRVLSAGGGRLGGARDYFTAQIFSPPYLFKGTRPTIVSAPSLLPLGSTATVQTLDASDIASVALVRLPSVTHMLDMDQRYLPLSFTKSGDRLTITAPPSADLAPAGYYMLFIINSNGVPSTAAILRVPTPQEDVQAPLPPQNLGAVGATSAVTLMWDASADNSGVVAYNVHRSSTPGFTPSALNQVARVNALFYTDFVAGGTYTYVVTAEDAAGNVSAPSNEAVATALADTTLPQVAITQPGFNTVVSGIVNVTANAFDNVVVAGVRFLVNGAALGSEVPEDTTAPYSVPWNTRSVVNGTYTLTAVARDGSGNQATSAPITVTVNNTAALGLVAAYGFEEASGTSVSDSSGLGNVGTIAGATRVANGRFGKALSFDGVNDVVTVFDSDSLDIAVGMTLEAWVYPRSLGQFSTIMMKEQFNDLAYVLYANTQYQGGVANRPSVEMNTSSNFNLTHNAAQLPLNTWTHVAATYDGKDLRLYINGAAVQRAAAGPIVQSSRELRIGGNLVWGEYFDGLIDEVRIYNRALTASEIQADRNAAVKP